MPAIERGSKVHDVSAAMQVIPKRDDLVLIRRAVLFIALFVALVAMQRFQSFLIPTVIGAFLALILTPIVSRVEGIGVSRGLAAAGVVLAALLTIGAVIYAALPSYDDYVERLPELIRDVERKIAPLKERAEDAGLIDMEVPAPLDGSEGESTAPVTDEMKLPVPDGTVVTDMALEAPSFLGKFLYVVFLTFFTVLDRRRLMRAVLATQSGFADRAWLFRVIRRMRHDVARYLLTVTVINACLGIATGLCFWAVGMPNPVLWGAGMALLNFIPYLGAGFMNMATLAVAFIHYPTLLMALLPVAILLTLNLLEGQLITPLVVGSNVIDGVLAVFLAVAFGAWLWGPAGAVLATPALIVGQTILRSRLEERRYFP